MKRPIAAALVLVACSAPVDPDGEPKPEPELCREGVSQSALTAVDRKIVGAASPYQADGTLRERDADLASSQRKRREVAWQTVAKVLSEVPLSEPLPNASELPAQVPLWQTWYDADDLRRVFHRVYGQMPKADKEVRRRFDEEALDDTFLWNLSAIDELPNWPVDRYIEYVEAVDQASEIAGLGGISRVAYSPGAARHLLRSYPEILRCGDDGVPPMRATGPEEVVDVAREAVTVATCNRQIVGSYSIEADETLHATLEDGEDATLSMHSNSESCTAEAGAPCEIEGPATVEIVVEAGVSDLQSIVAITRTSHRPEWAACLDGPFPLEAVVVKADYRRADFEMTMPVYSTSAGALSHRLSGDVSWEVPDGEADPDASDIYTLTLPGGASYRLAGLHIMTKELDHWLWITLWWSPSPSDDFGADRPASIARSSGPWKNYKMCVTTAFEEGDPSPSGGFDESHPSLADALSAVYAGQGAPTWCSNPYIEEGHGNAGSNCIGCHQHGGTHLLSEDVLLLSEHGRTELRNNFPTDYSWAVTSGDRLGRLFADEEAYYLGPR